MSQNLPAIIALEDGTLFHGESFTGPGTAYGELVFNTSMTGYQEILTDPSYHGQIVTMTYPLIGNYGINPHDVESTRPHVAGFVVGECSRIPSNWRSTQSLPDYLRQHNLLGIHRVDTRAVTFHIRSRGAMKCVMSTQDLDPQSLVAQAKASPGLLGRDLASEVTQPQPAEWPPQGHTLYRVIALDCGIKTNQLRILNQLGCHVTVVPIGTDPASVIATRPHGFFISNGPGDPDGAAAAQAFVKAIIDSGIPTFGICFGHQLIALALGGATYKMKFGHRGGNQPIKDHTTGKVEITSQNHGFCVDPQTLPPDVEVTHVNLNDNTCAGLRHKTKPLFSVQYHPEAAPGPHDSMYLFPRFIQSMQSPTPTSSSS